MFITLEGLDGSGKSTVIDALKEKYPGCVLTREPSEHEYGQLVRRNLSDESSDPLVDFFLFMADRRDHIEKDIRPNDENGLVISDRYADSTRAYQPVALSEGEDAPFDTSWEAKVFIEEAMRRWNYEPDLTLYIKISVDTAIDRCAGDEKYEDRDFLERVKENYDALAAAHPRIITIDGEQSRDAVAKQALGKIDVPAPDKI